MHFEEELLVNVSAKAAWDFLWNTAKVAACLPSCSGVKEVQPNKAYKAQFDDRIGPYRVHFEMDVSVQESRPPEHIHLIATGRDPHLGATQNVSLVVDLHERGPDSTAVAVVADIQILGKVATLGDFVIKRKVKDVVKEFARNLGLAIETELQGADA